ncbi:hypothetical protein Misp01_35900 [Microtetraspora sp. NBRC 13810]|nr:hypothetical protein Misp01_35900 [Microtetraspora sp. NBRC 13810]
MNGLNELVKALAAEHAAVYAYGLVCARTSGGLRTEAIAAFNAHRARRDQLRGLILARGGTPPEALPSYAVPFTPGTSAEAARLAAMVEDGVTSAYLELAAAGEPSMRRLAALAMQESVTRSYGFRPAIAALPGFPAPSTARTPAPAPPATPRPSRSGQ